jgi:FkbM family methyltransferase
MPPTQALYRSHMLSATPHYMLRLLLKRLPIPRGKERTIRAVHKLLGTPSGLVRVMHDDGILMDLDLHDYVQRSIFYHGCYERECVQVFKALLQPNWVVADCGAHVGQYSLIASKYVGATGEVHAFEPTPRTFSYLSRNISLNHAHNIYLNQFALTDNIAAAEPFFLSLEDNFGANSLRPTTNRLAQAAFTVSTTTLDSYFSNKDRSPEFIKLDVEGAEYAILLGATRILSTNRPWLQLEVSAENLTAFGCSLGDFQTFLSNSGYTLYTIHQSGTLRRLRGNLGEYQNLLCKPNDVHVPSDLHLD